MRMRNLSGRKSWPTANRIPFSSPTRRSVSHPLVVILFPVSTRMQDHHRVFTDPLTTTAAGRGRGLGGSGGRGGEEVDDGGVQGAADLGDRTAVLGGQR